MAGACWPAALRRGVAAVTMLTAAAGPAAAERVEVLSGEHGDFSRLALVLDRPTEFALTPTDAGYRLRFARDDIIFDLDGVFRYIPRDRLADLAPLSGPEGAGLAMTLGCDCIVEAFVDRPGLVVVDIRTGGSPTATPPPRPRPARLTNAGARPPRPRPVTARAPDPPGDGRAIDAAPIFWREHPEMLEARAELASAEGSAERLRPQRSRRADPDGEAGTPSPEAAREHLLRQLGRAAAQGLISADLAGPAPPAAPDAPPARADTPHRPPEMPPPDAPPTGDNSARSGAAPAAAGGHINLRARSAVDAALGLDALRDALAPGGRLCAEPAAFALGGHSDAPAAIDALSVQRRGLVGEFDDAVPEAVEALARTYLSLAFGAEARATLEAFPLDLPDGDILRAMADIVDGRPPTRPGRLAGMTACNGPAALWSVMARPELPEDADVNTGAVRRSFSALPRPLRRQLGPGLARRFLDAGDGEVARAIRAATARASDGRGARLRLLDGLLALEAGRIAAAERHFDSVRRGNTPAAPEALLRLARMRLERDAPVGDDVIADLSARAEEFRGSDLAERLLSIEARARARTGDFAGAFAAMGRLRDESDDGSGALRETRSAVYQALAESAGDPVFLDRVFAGPVWQEGGLARAVRQAVARRLLDLGFAAEAARMLPAYTEGSAPERALLARAALMRERPNEALRAVAGLAGQAAARLRGEAYVQLGEMDAAAAAFARAEAQERRAAAAWLAGNWDVVDDLGTPEQRGFLAASAPDAAAAPDNGSDDGGSTLTDATGAARPDEGMLARGRAQIRRSGALRGAVEALLQAHRLPEG
ncbi:hypothetical protein C2I36_08230 [Rhodobacteraceae bacterium WD3A24]|nr:hypothetical protein C2I36_08230 [Rhodobacteraceae bacterium WD3A24]